MAFVSQPHKCVCLGGYCWKNHCPKDRKAKEENTLTPSPAPPPKKKRRLKTLREQIRVYSAKPTDTPPRKG
jgi:hypothetical protein